MLVQTLEVFSKDRKKLAILENAFDIRETTILNAVSSLEFSLPYGDPKNIYCQRFNLVRYNNGEVYRIIKDGTDETETGYQTYECEHVIALLMDTIIPDFVNIGGLGIYTTTVINYVLNRQNTKHWVLKECDFTRQFEYGWEKENLLSALFSIPNRFVDDYVWVYDTSVYPYQISLKLLVTNRNPDHYIRKGYNRLTLTNQADSRYLCTRLYPYGAGEGVNQLTIAELNNDIKYLQSPPEFIEKYGLIERAWIDRRYTDQQSLLEAAQAMLNELQEPYIEYETEMIGNPKIGEIVQIVDSIKSVVIETSTLYNEVPEVTVKIANRPQDIAGTVADLADRQRIEMSYSQGASQIYADSIADNADGSTMLELRFYLPNEMININSVECKVRLSSFRAYTTNVISGGTTQTSSSGGGATTSSGGGTVTTTSSGGGTSTTTSSGGGATTSSGGDVSTSTQSGGGLTTFGGQNYTTTTANVSVIYPTDFQYPHAHGLPGFVTGHDHLMPSHTHQFTIPSHTHTVNAHTHSLTISEHSHSVTIGTHTHTVSAHTHSVDTSHTHNITPKISFFGSPVSFWLYINGQQKEFFNSTDAEIDLTQYLVVDRKIPRGTWHRIGILPNDLARVEISYNIMGFIQSRGDIVV